jgi:hypothetical protein
MKKIYLILRNVSLVLITGSFSASCSKVENPTTATATATDKISGTWIAETASSTGAATAQIMTQLTEYYIGTGLSYEEAKLQADTFEKDLLDSYKGTLQVNSDHTFTSDLTSDLSGFHFIGTWNLSAGDTALYVKVPRSVYVPAANQTLSWSDFHTYNVIDLTSSKPKLHFFDKHTSYLYNEKYDSADSINIAVDVYFTK